MYATHIMASRRQRRIRKRQRHRDLRPHPPKSRKASPVVHHAWPADQVERLTYTRKQAAEALGVSLSTIDRRVVPVLDTFLNEWGMRLIPVPELRRYVRERTELARAALTPRRHPGRPRKLTPEIVARIREEHDRGKSLGHIARGLNSDGIKTAQGGRQWWPSTVRSVLLGRR